MKACLPNLPKAALFLALAAGLLGMRAPADTLTTIVITPDSPTMQVGGQITFTAQGYDTYGNPVPINDPQWSANDQYGTITVNPSDPTQCTFTATKSGTGGIACGEGGFTGVVGSTDIYIVNSNTLAQIEVHPEDVTVSFGGAQQFTATGYDASHNPVTITPVWTTNGGTITSGGLYLATVAGDFIVTASVLDSPVTGEAQIHVTNELAQIEVHPEDVTVSFGGVQQFTATGYDASHNPVTITPVWTALGGSISPDKLYTLISSLGSQHILYTAGNLPGHYTITATQGQIEGRAWADILGASPPDLAPHRSWEHTFSTAGIYPYYDSHNLGLRGTVVVDPTLKTLLAPQAATVISITAAGFTPLSITIAVDGTVRWINADKATHAIRGGEPYIFYLPLMVKP